MIPNLISCNSTSLTPTFPIPFFKPSKSLPYPSISLPPYLFSPSRCAPICFSKSNNLSNSINDASSDSFVQLGGLENGTPGQRNLNMQVGNQILPSFIQSSTQLGSVNHAFFLLSFIACSTCVAFTSLVIVAVPTLNSMRRTAISLSKLADAAREELPSTMASIRLSGMEISDLTLELSDLSHEISDGVKKSAQAVQAAEAGVRQIGALAHQHTMTMIEERASLPIISVQAVVAGAVKKTSNAVGQATKTLINMISRGVLRSENEDPDGIKSLDF